MFVPRWLRLSIRSIDTTTSNIIIDNMLLKLSKKNQRNSQPIFNSVIFRFNYCQTFLVVVVVQINFNFLPHRLKIWKTYRHRRRSILILLRNREKLLMIHTILLNNIDHSIGIKLNEWKSNEMARNHSYRWWSLWTTTMKKTSTDNNNNKKISMREKRKKGTIKFFTWKVNLIQFKFFLFERNYYIRAKKQNRPLNLSQIERKNKRYIME